MLEEHTYSEFINCKEIEIITVEDIEPKAKGIREHLNMNRKIANMVKREIV